ncbi:MAG TPA: dihydroneopterin aldolase [Actinocrinis sp.]|jgi:dihydroneopterin aldolase
MSEAVGGRGDRPDGWAALDQTVLDRIVLRGVRAQGRHGVYEHERNDGQTFVVDAALYLDTRTAARDDDLAATADYGTIAQKIVAAIEGEPVNLIETLAARVAEACLADPAVQAAEVTVHKPEAPIAAPFQDVAVTIRREAGR